MADIVDPVQRIAMRETEFVVDRAVERIRTALIYIRNSGTWRESHATFEAYCTARWGVRAELVRSIIDGDISI